MTIYFHICWSRFLPKIFLLPSIFWGIELIRPKKSPDSLVDRVSCFYYPKFRKSAINIAVSSIFWGILELIRRGKSPDSLVDPFSCFFYHKCFCVLDFSLNLRTDSAGKVPGQFLILFSLNLKFRKSAKNLTIVRIWLVQIAQCWLCSYRSGTSWKTHAQHERDTPILQMTRCRK